jgi:site-specific recombinase XerD
MSRDLTILPPSSVQVILDATARDGIVVPRMVADAGDRAAARFLEFFAGTIRNRNTRMAYIRAVGQFFAWCDRHRIGGIEDIEPLHVAAYIETLQVRDTRKSAARKTKDGAKPTVKQHLAAVRKLFDWLVVGQVIATNPAHAVRGPKHVVGRGKTKVLISTEARTLLDSIPITRIVKLEDGKEEELPCLVGLRDRALIAVMTFTFARIGAAVAMAVEDYYPQGKRWWLRLHEKNAKEHEMPAHHNLEAYLDAYIEAAGIREDDKGPLFRSALPIRPPPPVDPTQQAPKRRRRLRRRSLKQLTNRPMTRVDAWRMIRRRADAVPSLPKIGCHTFRATGITAYLENGGTLENAQRMAAHSSPRTTKLYDRRDDKTTLDEVERIAI